MIKLNILTSLSVSSTSRARNSLWALLRTPLWSTRSLSKTTRQSTSQSTHLILMTQSFTSQLTCWVLTSKTWLSQGILSVTCQCRMLISQQSKTPTCFLSSVATSQAPQMESHPHGLKSCWRMRIILLEPSSLISLMDSILVYWRTPPYT